MIKAADVVEGVTLINNQTPQILEEAEDSLPIFV